MSAILFIVLVFFGLRLLFWCAWRIMVLAVLLPVGMAACALYAVPGMRSLFGWWARTWGGLLLAQIPSVLALSIGTQLFAHGSGLMAFMFAVAAMQVASDIYKILPGVSGGHGGGAPWGFLPLAPLAMRAATPAPVVAGALSTTSLTDKQISQVYGYR